MKNPDDQLALHAPKVSIVISCYNYADFIEAAMHSVAVQTYEDIECIVVDDCSSDSSRDVIKTFLSKDKTGRFRLIENVENLGQLGSLKSGFEQSAGHFVAFLDADDILAPHFVETHIAAHLNAAVTAGMSCSDMLIIDEQNYVLAGTWSQLQKIRFKHTDVYGLHSVVLNELNELSAAPRFYEPQDQMPQLTRFEAHNQNWVYSPTSACMYRRDMLRFAMPDDAASWRISSDYCFNVLCAMFSGCLIIDAALSGYRVHQSNNFSVNPVVGGDARPGLWSKSIQNKYDSLLAAHVESKRKELFDTFGPHRVEHVLKKLRKGPSVPSFRSDIWRKLGL